MLRCSYQETLTEHTKGFLLCLYKALATARVQGTSKGRGIQASSAQKILRAKKHVLEKFDMLFARQFQRLIFD